MDDEKRIGRQTPTQSVVLPYTETKGKEAIGLYNSTGRTAQPWQELMIYDVLATNDEGLWVHPKFGYSVPRRNGKGEILTIRELFALRAGEKTLHTAHRTATSSAASLRLANLLRALGYSEILRVKKDQTYSNAFVYSKQFGLEKITLLDTGATVDFRTRTSSGGLGEGFDLLIIDEAQEYTSNQQSTLQFTVSDSLNPQIILCGTPPTAVSSGTVFMDLRDSCLGGETEETGWAEWGIDHMTEDLNDIELWYEFNPAMGFQLNERKVRNEDKKDKVDYNIQRFGFWPRYNQKSAISKAEWAELCLGAFPQISDNLYVGIKYGHDGENVAMSVAAKTNDGKIFIEGIDCQSTRNGDGWIMPYLIGMKPKKIIIDGSGKQQLLLDQLKDLGIKNGSLPTVKDVVVANAAFEKGLYGKTICHMEQPSMEQAVSNCERRPIGSNGGFGYKAIKEGIEIALLDSAILAFWACSESKDKKKQRIIY